MKNRRSLIIVIVVVFIILVVGVAYVLQNHNKSAPAVQNLQPEQGGPKTVAIGNMGDLSSIMLAEQFEATKTQLIAYIQTQVSPKITTAQVVGTPQIEGNGNVDFTVQTSNPTKQFSVHIDRSLFYQLVFSVVGTGYQQTVQFDSNDSND